MTTTAAPAGYRPVFDRYPRLRPLDSAPAAVAPPQRIRIVLACTAALVGAVLAVAPVVGGLPYAAAAADQMLHAFRPFLEPAALAATEHDLDIIAAANRDIESARQRGILDDRRYPFVAAYANHAAAIQRDAHGLLDSVRAGRPDVDQLSAIRGLRVLPYLVVLAGLAIAAGALLTPRRTHRRIGWALVAAAVAALTVHPVAARVAANGAAAGRLADGFASIMTEKQVRTLQADFVVLVSAVGELDHGLPEAMRRADPTAPTAGVDEFRRRWQSISAAFAALIGVLNDNVANFRHVVAADNLVRIGGRGAFALLPAVEWLAAGVVAALLAAGAAADRRRPSLTKARR